MHLKSLEPDQHQTGSVNSSTHSRLVRCELARPKRIHRGGVICGDLPARCTMLVPRRLELERALHHLYRTRLHTYHQAQALRLLTTRLLAAYTAPIPFVNIWTHSMVNNRMAHRTQPDLRTDSHRYALGWMNDCPIHGRH